MYPSVSRIATWRSSSPSECFGVSTLSSSQQGSNGYNYCHLLHGAQGGPKLSAFLIPVIATLTAYLAVAITVVALHHPSNLALSETNLARILFCLFEISNGILPHGQYLVELGLGFSKCRRVVWLCSKGEGVCSWDGRGDPGRGV